MGLLKKKRTTQPQEDTVSIDAAMEELSKQTEALLGGFGEEPKTPKPDLPKKNAKFATRGKSFDIIHDPRRKTQLRSTLKTSAPVAIKEPSVVEDAAETPLLPEHATESYNEVEVLDQSPVDSVVANEEAPALIKGHAAKLTFSADESTQANADAGVEAVSVEEPEIDTHEPTEPQQLTSSEPLSFNESPLEDKKETEVSEENAPLEKTDDSGSEEEPTEPSPQDVTEKPSNSAAEGIYASGELHANNLVKEVEPQGYQASEDSAAPAVFDTEEYHPELHDWSKLEHKTGSRWFLLVLLIIVACGLGYFVISGQQLPF